MTEDALNASAPLPLILLIDDHEDLRLTWALLLEFHGFDVIAARNGLEGVKLAMECVPALIITDLMMPELDGIGVCRAIRSSEQLSSIPIILWTAGTPVGTQGLASVSVRKPVSIEIMIAHIVQLLNQSSSGS